MKVGSGAGDIPCPCNPPRRQTETTTKTTSTASTTPMTTTTSTTTTTTTNATTTTITTAPTITTTATAESITTSAAPATSLQTLHYKNATVSTVIALTVNMHPLLVAEVSISVLLLLSLSTLNCIFIFRKPYHDHLDMQAATSIEMDMYVKWGKEDDTCT